MPVHMRGAPCRMDELMGLANEHGLKVIEDVAQANGGSYKGRALGTFGDVGCFSPPVQQDHYVRRGWDGRDG